MSEDHDPESKTEEATEKKIHDALERGDAPMSRELPILASLAAILIISAMVLPVRGIELAALLRPFVDDPAGWRLATGDDVLALYRVVFFRCAAIVWPILALLMVFGVVASIVQQAPRVVSDRIAPKMSRISIRNGVRKIFGPRGWTEFLKSLLKLSAVGLMTVLILSGQKGAMLTAMAIDVGSLPNRLLELSTKLIASVIATTLAVAAADLAWTRILWRRDQRMSRQEVKEELRQLEGDRMIKARLRSLRLDRSRKRMLAAVPKATMVVANPTHYAVALRYVRAEGGAPLVVAKGMDLIALKIREIAEESSIPIIEDKPLARSLYDAVTVDSVIPPEFYRAVAEIVHLIQDRNGVRTVTRNRMMQ